MYVQVSGTNKCLAILFVKFVSMNLHFDVSTTKFASLEYDAIIRILSVDTQYLYDNYSSWASNIS